MKTVLKRNPRELEHAPDQIKRDYDFVLRLYNGFNSVIRWASRDLLSNRDFILDAIKKGEYGRDLYHASDDVKRDRDVVLAAVRKNGNALYYADRVFRQDREVVIEAVQNYGFALEHASDRLCNDRGTQSLRWHTAAKTHHRHRRPFLVQLH